MGEVHGSFRIDFSCRTETGNNNGLNNLKMYFSLTGKKSRDIQPKASVVDAQCHHEPRLLLSFLYSSYCVDSILKFVAWSKMISGAPVIMSMLQSMGGGMWKGKKAAALSGSLPVGNFPQIPHITLCLRLTLPGYLGTLAGKTGECSLLVGCNLAPYNIMFFTKRG